jgi:hypothetical protein
MTAGTFDIEPSLRQQFTFGHIALIIGVTLLLTGFLFVKDPQYFSLHLHNGSGSVNPTQTAPRYQPYAAAPQPEVLGASTEANTGPEVLNEDGTLSSATDPGDVLGDSTALLATDLAAINVKTTKPTQENVAAYLDTMLYWESTAIDQTAFEAALTSNNQTQINTQIQSMQTMLHYLQGMVVPADAAQLHKLKIVQYRSAIILLQNFSQADSNPQLVTDQLGLFLSSQQQQDQETLNLQQKYNLLANE